MEGTPFSSRQIINWCAVAAALSLAAALLSTVPAAAQIDEPPEVAAVDKSAASPVSPNYDPTNADRGNERVNAGANTSLPPLVFPADNVLGDIDAIRAKLDAAPGSAKVRVIVTARPLAGFTTGDLPARLGRLPDIAAALSGTGSTITAQGRVIPFVAATVTTAGLDALLATDATGSIELDLEGHANLASATAVTGADVTNDQSTRGGGNSTGTRWEVAILDNGVRTSHQAFGSRIVDEACFTSDSSCPNGGTSQTGPGAGVSNSNGGHGTHVAGISAAADLGAAAGGVAQEAGIIAVNVFDTGGSAFFSNVTLGVDFVLARELAGAKIAAINISIGVPNLPFTSVCDSVFPALATAIAAARDQGILVVVAAGNDGFTSATSFPACISGATAVSSSTDADLASNFTNIHPTLSDLWAPGSDITSTWDTGDTDYSTLNGTSMASPHVAGAVTALADCFDWDTPNDGSISSMDDDILGRLINTGVSVADNRAGGTVTLPRLDLLAAARNLNNNDSFADAEVLLGTSGSDIDYSHCSTEEPDEPNNDGVASTWYTWTSPAVGTATFSTCDAQTTADTLIHVYTGDTLAGLVQVAANDDDAGCTESVLHSTLSFAATTGTTYRIRLSVHRLTAHGNGVYNTRFSLAPVACNGFAVTVDVGAGDSPTDGDDVILGTPGPDTISGLGGNDTICGGGGDDTIAGNAGDDIIFGDAGNDTIYGGADNDTIHGGTGDDTIQGNDGVDIIFGDTGADVLSGNTGDDTLNGGDGNDTLYGVAGIDTINGDAGADTILGGLDADLISGGTGNDLISGNAGADQIDGDNGNDTLYGSTEADTINGGLGLDIILGGTGDDTIDGGPDRDLISGNENDDTINGGTGNDDLFGVDGADTINGDAGIDLILGGNGDDTITGGTEGDLISGNAGNDIIDGGDGNDEIYGVGGIDTLTGGAGTDIILGGPDNDTINSDGDGAIDQVSGNAGVDTCNADTGPVVFDAVFLCEGP